MKLKLYTLTIAGLSLFFVSCKTASKMYEKGNYDEAVELAAKKLQKKPNDPKLLNIIQEAYRYAVNDHESRIHTYSESNNELKWEWMYNEYAFLQKMYDAIYRVPDVYEIVKPVSYSSYLVTYAEKAADVRFDRGIAFMNSYNKESYRNAYREFQASLRFRPGYRDAIQKMNESYEYAVTNVVILPMQQDGGFVYNSFNVGGNNLDDQVIRNLQYNSGDEFVKFYSAWDVRSKNIRIDMEVDMNLSTVDIGRYHDTRNIRKVSKEVVIKEIVYRPDSVVRQYGKVFAEITTTRRTMSSSAVLHISVRDANGHWVWGDNFGSDHNWYTEFSAYTGDSRALTESDKQLVDRRKEFAPSENEIMRCLIDELSNTAQYRLRNYFSRY